MTTLNNIIEEINKFCTAHKQINSFFSGQVHNFQSYTNKYTAVVLVPIPSTIVRGRTRLSFYLFVIDQLNQDRSNKDEVLSDTLSITQDFISYFADNEDIVGFTLNEGEEIPIEPLEEEMDDIVAGWVSTISIDIGFSGNVCIIPLETDEIDGETDIGDGNFLDPPGKITK